MSIVKHTDKRTGVTYVYESESYWDKEKQQSRSHRKMIGRIDPEYLQHLKEKDILISELQGKIRKLERERNATVNKLESLLRTLNGHNQRCDGTSDKDVPSFSYTVFRIFMPVLTKRNILSAPW